MKKLPWRRHDQQGQRFTLADCLTHCLTISSKDLQEGLSVTTRLVSLGLTHTQVSTASMPFGTTISITSGEKRSMHRVDIRDTRSARIPPRQHALCAIFPALQLTYDAHERVCISESASESHDDNVEVERQKVQHSLRLSCLGRERGPHAESTDLDWLVDPFSFPPHS